MPSLPAEITLATEATLRSSSTKLHGSILTILTMVLPPLLILWPLWYMGKQMLPRARKPHGTVSTVSELHRDADIGRVTKHDMSLNVTLHVPCLSTKITLATEATLRSSSTKLHGSIPTIPTIVLPPSLILRPLWYVGKQMLPRAGKPHGTVSTVSELHHSAEIQRVAKHDMSLNITL